MRTVFIDGVEHLLIKIKKINREVFFTNIKDAEKHIFKKVWVGKNKVTGDRSYLEEPLDVVAEDDKRIQVIVYRNYGNRMAVLCKKEYDIEIAKTR